MKIAIADRQSHIRSALHLLISEKTEHLVVSEIKHANALQERLIEIPIDLLIIEWALIASDTTETLKIICNKSTVAYIIVMSSDESVKQLAIDAGADGFVSKSDVPETILTVIRQLNSDE